MEDTIGKTNSILGFRKLLLPMMMGAVLLGTSEVECEYSRFVEFLLSIEDVL